VFYSSFTARADRPAPAPLPPADGRSHTRTLFTWALLIVWALLMSFGVIAWRRPQWIQPAAQHGKTAEARTYKNYGDAELRKGNYGSAIAQYDASLEIEPDQPQVVANLGIARVRARQTDAGRQLLEQALQLDPGPHLRGVIQYHLGDIHETAQQPDEAIACFQQAADAGLEAGNVYARLGALYSQTERFDEALRALETALAAQMDVRRSYQQMILRSREAYAEDPARLAAVEALAAQPISPEEFARYDVELIRQLQEHDPEIAKTHNHLAFIYGRQGNWTEARRHLEESLRIWPGNADAKRMMRTIEQQAPASP
jgi:tetratricopeptide (TPR) repeat protein